MRTRGVTGWLAVLVALSGTAWNLGSSTSTGAELSVVGATVGLLPAAVAVAAGVVLVRDARAWVAAAAIYLAVFGAIDATSLPAQARWLVTSGAEASTLWSAANAVAGLALAVLAVVVVLRERDEPAEGAPTGWPRGVGVACGVALALSGALPWWSSPGFGGVELVRSLLRWPLAFQVSAILGVLVALAAAMLVGTTRSRGVWLGAVAGLLGSRPLVIGSLIGTGRTADVGPEPAMWVALVAQLGLAVVLVVALAGPDREPAPAP